MSRPLERNKHNSQMTTVLKAISNIKRLQILNELADGKEKSVSELESVVPELSQSALSQHLGRLRRANIVKTRRESQSIFYSVENDEVIKILRFLWKIYSTDLVIKKNEALKNLQIFWFRNLNFHFVLL